jgi:hypothetical protein
VKRKGEGERKRGVKGKGKKNEGRRIFFHGTDDHVNASVVQEKLDDIAIGISGLSRILRKWKEYPIHGEKRFR